MHSCMQFHIHNHETTPPKSLMDSILYLDYT